MCVRDARRLIIEFPETRRAHALLRKSPTAGDFAPTAQRSRTEGESRGVARQNNNNNEKGIHKGRQFFTVSLGSHCSWSPWFWRRRRLCPPVYLLAASAQRHNGHHHQLVSTVSHYHEHRRRRRLVIKRRHAAACNRLSRIIRLLDDKHESMGSLMGE